WVFLEVGADTGAVGDDGDAEGLQVRARSDTGAQQERGRVQRTGGEDDLVGHELPRRAAAIRDLDAGRTPLLDQETTDAGIGQEGQVRAAARLRVEVGRGGRDAPVVEVVDGDREVTRSEVFVLVLDVGETGVEEGVGGGAGEGGPVVADDAPDR